MSRAVKGIKVVFGEKTIVNIPRNSKILSLGQVNGHLTLWFLADLDAKDEQREIRFYTSDTEIEKGFEHLQTITIRRNVRSISEESAHVFIK